MFFYHRKFEIVDWPGIRNSPQFLAALKLEPELANVTLKDIDCIGVSFALKHNWKASDEKKGSRFVNRSRVDIRATHLALDHVHTVAFMDLAQRDQEPVNWYSGLQSDQRTSTCLVHLSNMWL